MNTYYVMDIHRRKLVRRVIPYFLPGVDVRWTGSRGIARQCTKAKMHTIHYIAHAKQRNKQKVREVELSNSSRSYIHTALPLVLTATSFTMH